MDICAILICIMSREERLGFLVLAGFIYVSMSCRKSVVADIPI